MAAQPFDPSFDPTGAVRFDLRSGSASDSGGARLVLVPSAALESLDASALAQIGDHVGRACGKRLAARLGGDGGVRAAELELVVTHLAGELALAGIGAVHIERWGRAMVAVVANPSVTDDGFVSAVLSGALSVASGRDVTAAALGREGGKARYFVGSAATSERVRGLVAQGKGYAAVVAILQGGAS
jgi:hypothetical protein